ncbi:MAG: hypothetical protein ACRC1F_03170, partial [Metamycoplasmataceae bacterium]
FISFSDFDKSIKLFDGDKEITDYSNITVNEAYINNFFRFEVPSKVKFYANKNGIDVFMKSYNENLNSNNFDVFPSYYNSSIPEFRIWFGKGVGADRVEDFIVVSGAGLFGFKKTQEENDVTGVINLFQNSILLKPEFYVNFPSDRTIRDGVFAKTIKSTDIISNLSSEQLNGVDWKVTSVSQDPKIPSTLVVYIDFSKGVLNKNFFSQTFQKFEIQGFPIEMGVDDYESKVRNFIEDEQNRVGLGEAFEYKRPDSQPEGSVGTVLENYQQNAFTFDLPFSFQNRATNAGVEYIFKPWVKDGSEDSAFPDEENSEIPKFKIYIRSGSGTPFEYEDFFVVRGNGQVTNIPFDKTDNHILIDKLRELGNSGSDNPFNSETIILTLINEFALFDTNRKGITANIIANVDKPLDNISLSVGNLDLPQDIIIPGGVAAINVKATEVTNRQGQDNLSIKIEFSLGTEFVDKGLFFRTINYAGFESERNYNIGLMKKFNMAIDNDDSFVVIKTKIPITPNNTNSVIESIRLGNGDFYFFEEVFVGYDSIMDDFKWSSKPKFNIDFAGTVVENDNIKFKIIITSGPETETREITRPISSFYDLIP